MRFRAFAIPTFCFLSLAACAVAKPPATQPSGQAAPDQAALDKQFEKTLTNATLVGHFTLDGDKNPAHAEHYTIAGVRKLGGDKWLFDARIRYGNHDLTLPLTLTVKWAGDTPIITVQNLGFPGLGQYSARVVIFNDHYAGVWTGGPTHQGTLSGRIEHPAKPAEPAQAH